MMRLIVTVLILLTLVLGIWSFVDHETFLLAPNPEGYQWWWPTEISTIGDGVDALFYFVAFLILIAFTGTFLALAYAIWKFSAKRSDKAVFTHGSHKLEMIWTSIPAVLLVVIAVVQMQSWAAIKYPGAFQDEEGLPLPPFAEIWANQFNWMFRYAGPDGRFGTADDIESQYELVVPLGDTKPEGERKLLFNLRSVDVIHSFFVPNLRLKQDAVPGMTIPIWWEIELDEFEEVFGGKEDQSMDIICAELCGWGHYKMAGRLIVLPDAEYAEWMQAQVEAKYSKN
ncbi:MAG: cytochrome c oxidase subunit 2 [Planctomycetota bacterium]|jgi:cytochrome c oxidase subunit 2